MRIHHVVPSVLADYGGPSVSVPALCQELVALGHEVTLHTYAPAPAAGPDGCGYGLRSYRVSRAAGVVGLGRLGLSADMARGLREAALGGDIMHVHGLWTFSSVLPAWAVRGTACRLVVAPRGMLDAWALRRSARPKRLMWAACQGPVLRRAGLIHATAESEVEAVRALGVATPIALVPNGVVMPSDADAARFGSGRRTLLFLSRLHPKKGLEPLLRAWTEVQREFTSWELSIVGPDSDGYAATLKTLAGSLGAERVSFPGPAFEGAKAAHFRAAQLFILPTHSENFGQAVAEALAHGVPAIVGRGAPWEGLVRERCGYWIDNSVEAIAACLRDALARTPDELRTLGERGMAWMMRDFSWRERARSMAEAYAWPAGGGDKPDVIS